jgi:signal transduction histidine kinase
VILKLDQLRLQQVIINLLSNAIKFSKSHDTIKIDVITSVHKANSANIDLCVKVIDTGMGITQQDLNNLF